MQYNVPCRTAFHRVRPLPVGERAPKALKLFVKLLSDAGRASPVTVVGNPDLGGMPDDSPAIEGGKFGRHPPNEMPCAMTACKEISHGSGTLLDVLLDVLLDGAKNAKALTPNDMVQA